jgi:DNA-binding NarL/FixJ family response regulator
MIFFINKGGVGVDSGLENSKIFQYFAIDQNEIPMPIRVIIADDDRFFRTGLKAELSKYEDIEIAGEAINGDELIIAMTSDPPDICLLDLHMPKVSGMEVLGIMREAKIKTHAIVISADDEEKNILRAL